MSDFGTSAWRVSRKQRRCDGCLAVIPSGERHYHFSGMWEGEWQNWRMHEECYADWDANGEYEFMPGDLPVPERLRGEA